MNGGANSHAGPALPPLGGAEQPTPIIIDGLGCFDEWDTLAVARLPIRDLLRAATRWIGACAGRA
jgi:hypothetical protein